LSPGIVWAFKKPILFLPFHNITAISYTSVLQRTFNLVVTARDPITEAESEIEFSMLDQANFAGIDDYIKRHELSDASLAAERRAKVYNVNKKAGIEPDATNGAANGGPDESEIQKAEQMLQDEEDEDEEDYVDEGSNDEGSSDEEDEEGGGDDEEVFEEEEDFEEEAGGYEDEG
jgi:hypothetical protein